MSPPVLAAQSGAGARSRLSASCAGTRNGGPDGRQSDERPRGERGGLRAPGRDALERSSSGRSRNGASERLRLEGPEGRPQALRLPLEGQAGGEAPQGSRRGAVVVRKSQAVRSGSRPPDEGM